MKRSIGSSEDQATLTPAKPTRNGEELCTRRAFLATAVAGSVAAVSGEFWSRLHASTQRHLPAFRVRLPEAQGLAPGEARAFTVPGTMIEALLVRVSREAFLAVDRRCPHLGCPVQWVAEASHFECPCHAAVFEGTTGRVLKGPPRFGLRRFSVEQRDGALWVLGAGEREES